MVLAGRLVSLLQVSRKSSVPGEAKGVATSLTPPELLGSVGNWIPPAKRSQAEEWSKRQTDPAASTQTGEVLRKEGGRASLLAQAFQLWPAVLFLQPPSCCCC